MSDVFCKQCGVTDDQQAKCDDGCGGFAKSATSSSTWKRTRRGQDELPKKARSAPRANGQLSGEQTVAAVVIFHDFHVPKTKTHLSREA